MKRIRRPQILPPTLRVGAKGGDEAKRREAEFQASHQVENVNKDFQDHWGEADVRGSLWAMQGRSCAYCDRELPGNDRGDVEHFRPKDFYWWLAYRFENYLLSCSVCNSSYKRNLFPILPPDTPFDYAGKNVIDQEGRALIDPVADSVDGWFAVDFDVEQVKRQSFQLTINPGLAPRDQQRCETTRDLFKLNEDSELLRARQLAVHKALKLVSKANKGDDDSKQELRQQAVRYCSHSFVVREVIVSHAQRPEYLPSSEDQVAWLVEELIVVLQFALNTLQKRPKDTTETNQRDRAAWALAVLIKDPPALSSAAIRARLEAENVWAVVEPHLNKL